VKALLLATISMVLFVSGLVTLNFNSVTWAKDDSKDTFGMSDSTNKGNDRSDGCESIPQCKSTLDNAMDKLNNLPKPILPKPTFP
jgi:hypothetical protein